MRRPRRPIRRTAVALALALAASLVLLTACGGDELAADAPTTDAAATDDAAADVAASDVTLSGELTVFAAASLTDAFEELGGRFEALHPDVAVTLNLASSSTLATQLLEGAPADVFASADDTQMAAVTDAGLASGPVAFTTNELAIVVEAGDPLGIAELEDLTRDDVVLVLAAPEVPAGRFAAEMLAAAGIAVSPSSLEVDVRATLSKVELGEADAAIVYRSDVVTADGTVEGVAIPDDRNVTASYPIVTLAGAPNPDAAAAFLALVRGPEGQAALAAAGFTAP